ncbi:MAG: hypothetical protein ACJ75H_00145, partial [Thermoanaerobaculia bacterium]
DRSAAQIARLTADATRERLTRTFREERVRRDREQADSLWPRLKRHPLRARQLLVERAPEFHTWAMCERLCEESAKAAAADAGRALDLADLALLAAIRGPGGEAWHSRLQGYAWAFLANARRVANDLPEAEKAFATAWKLWEAGEEIDPEPLQEWRLYDLQASLRRDQRRLAEALDLLERAELKNGAGKARGRVLVNKATILEQMGEHERAIEMLEQAESLVDQKAEPRIAFASRFILVANLLYLGRHGDAAAALPGVRSAAIQLGNDLDLIRVLWLDGRTAAGLGRRVDALAAFEQVRSEFASRRLLYDVALVTLELAVLHLEEGRAERVKDLVREMAPIFRAQKVHREALAALKIFREAAMRQKATADLAKRVVAYLCQARHDPSLKFPG